MTVTVAIDCMGGDHGPEVTVRAALEFVRKHDDVRAILVGIEDNKPDAIAAMSARVKIRPGPPTRSAGRRPSCRRRR